MSGPAHYSALSKPSAGDPTRPVLEMTFRGHRRDICCAAFQPSANALGEAASATALPPRLLTAGADGAVMLWDARPTNRALRFVGHRGPVLGCDYCPKSVAGASVTLLASCGLDGYARLWVPNLRRTSTTYPSNYLTQQQQQHKSSGGADENGSSWRVHTGAARAIKFAQDGSNHIYTCGDDKSVKAWDLNYVANGSYYPSGEPLVSFRGARFLGNFNASTSADQGRKVTSFKSATTHTNWVRSLAVQRATASFSHYVASGGDDNVVMVWDTRSPHAGPAHTFYEHHASVRGITFHDNGFHLASCDASGILNLYDMRRSSSSSSSSAASALPERRKPRYGLLQHYADAHGAGGIAVNEVCFAPSFASRSGSGAGGSWLLSAGDDGTAKLWDTVEGFLYCTVQAHAGAVRSVSFTDDGGFFVTAGADGVAMVWRSEMTRQKADLSRSSVHLPPTVPRGGAMAATVTAPAPTRQEYSYYDGDDEAAESPAAMEEEERPAPSVTQTKLRTATTAAGVDASYAAWQRSHNLLKGHGGDRAGKHGKAGRRHMPASPASSVAVEAGDSPKPHTSSASRPPLPPRDEAAAAALAPFASSSQHAAAVAEEDGGGGRAENPQRARERSFERSEERYSHISTPQKEQQARERRGKESPLQGSAAGRRVSFHTAEEEERDIKEQEDLVRRERQHGALAERRLENVESAVASLVEYVQEENAHRDRELSRLHDEVDRRHGRQREEMLALKGMMEQLIAQQTALLAKLGVDTAASKLPPPQQQHHEHEHEQESVAHAELEGKEDAQS